MKKLLNVPLFCSLILFSFSAFSGTLHLEKVKSVKLFQSSPSRMVRFSKIFPQRPGLVITADDNGNLVVWDLETSEVWHRLRYFDVRNSLNSRAISVDLSDDGRFLVMGSFAKLELLDLLTGKTPLTYWRPEWQPEEFSFSTVKFLDDKKMLFAYEEIGNTIYVFDTESGEIINQFATPFGAPMVIRFSADKTKIILISDKGLIVRDILSAKTIKKVPAREISGSESLGFSLALSANRNWIATNDRQYIHVYDFENLQRVQKINCHHCTLLTMQFDNGNENIIGLDGNFVASWNVLSGEKSLGDVRLDWEIIKLGTYECNVGFTFDNKHVIGGDRFIEVYKITNE